MVWEDKRDFVMLSLELGGGDYLLEISKSQIWCTARVFRTTGGIDDAERGELVRTIAEGSEGCIMASLDHIIRAADTAIGMHRFKASSGAVPA
jgi:hypothetical protein